MYDGYDINVFAKTMFAKSDYDNVIIVIMKSNENS